MRLDNDVGAQNEKMTLRFYGPRRRLVTCASYLVYRLAVLACLLIALTAASRGSLRALRIRPGGTVTTVPSPNLPVNGDMTLRILIKRNPWDLVSHEILSITDADGAHRVSLAMNTSPWVTAFISDNGWMPDAHKYGWEGAVNHGCPNGTYYEDWWLVYKAPTTTIAGYFRVYRSGALAPFYSDTIPFDIPIPAGTDMTWKGKGLMLRIGDPNPATMTDYQVMDVAWWTEALTDADVAALANRQISTITDNIVRRLSSLYWYARPSNTYLDRIACELGASTGNSSLDAVFTGNVTYTTDTPRVPGWDQPGDIVPPDPGTAPIEASSTDEAISAIGQTGSADTSARTLVVSEGALWEYTAVAQAEFGPSGLAEISVDGLKPGTTYFVTGKWSDADGNVASRQVTVKTAGASPLPPGPTRTLHVTGAAEAITATDSYGLTPLLARMPFETDTTIRLLVRRNGNWSGLSRFFSQRAGSAGAYGYARFAIGTAADGHLVAQVSDGQTNFEADADEMVSNSSFDEVWMVYIAPTATTAGSVSLYKGTVLKNTVPIPAGTDMSWKKWDAQLVLGGLMTGSPNPAIDYDMLEPAWWTKALTPAEMAAINGKPLYALDDATRQMGYLYWYTRPHYASGKIEPDLGASIGTTAIRQPASYTYNDGTLTPLISTAVGNQITFGDAVPPGFGGPPYTVADALDALRLAAGLSGGRTQFARVNVEAVGDSAYVSDIADAVRITRIVAGLD